MQRWRRHLPRSWSRLLLASLCVQARRWSGEGISLASSGASLRPRVCTYNVLSSHLSDPSYFPHCDPEHLDADNRFSLLLKKMDIEMEKNSIICLQEVSSKWAGQLHCHFGRNDYHFVTALYGNAFDGYMGVGMAFPRKLYELENADIKRISDTKKIIQRTPQLFPKPPPPPLSNFRSFFSRFLKSQPDPPPAPPGAKVWAEVLRRKNEMISLQLKCKSSYESFYVGNYHMPCMFKIPEVMAIHAALASQHLHRLATLNSFEMATVDTEGDKITAGFHSSSPVEGPTDNSVPRKGKVLPYILAGDFNIQPNSSVYNLLTQGYLPSDHNIPSYGPSDNWTIHTNPLKSAYFLAHESEPDFTNHARIRGEEPFIETLDYIFLSSSWRIRSVDPLKSRHDVTGPYPTQHEPSDHVLIAADIELENLIEED